MADKAISELVAAEQIKSTDMFVLEQDGTAKRLQGQTLLNWLTAAADGHGGISNIAKTGTDGLVDTYTITLADTTTKTFTVTNGNGLTNFEKLSTVGLVDNYRFTRTDGTFFDFSVYNGAKGDKGDDSHVWIKYASQQPTADSHSMGDLPDAWMGVYSGTAAEAPDDWQQYTWYQIKGEKGDTGAAATVTGTTVEYMVSDSGTIVPSGSWSTTIPTVPQGKYLWTKVTTTFNTGSPAVSYSVTRMGIDGAGSVSSVNEKSPDESGNVSLSAEDIPTSSGGSVQAVLEGKQEALTAGENISISGSVIATKAFPCNPNLLRNWYFGRPVNQRGVSGTISTAGYFLDGWKLVSGSVTIGADGITLNGTMAQVLEDAPVGTVTATALTEEGVVPVGYDSTTKTFTVTAAGTKLIAAKLELGDVQTLAHLYGGAWELNQLPDYGAELARGQRYLVPLASDLVQAVIIGTGTIFFFVPLPVTMRAKPTIVVDDFKVRSVMGGTDQTGFTFAVTAARANGVMISAAKASHGMTAAALNAGAVSLLSAEL